MLEIANEVSLCIDDIYASESFANKLRNKFKSSNPIDAPGDIGNTQTKSGVGNNEKTTDVTRETFLSLVRNNRVLGLPTEISNLYPGMIDEYEGCLKLSYNIGAMNISGCGVSCRLLSYNEKCNSEATFKIKYKRLSIVPVINVGNDQQIVYSPKTNVFALIDISTGSTIKKSRSLNDVLPQE